MQMINGHDIINLGIRPGRHIGAMIPLANKMRAEESATDEAIFAALQALLPPPPMQLRSRDNMPHPAYYLEPDNCNSDEVDNAIKVSAAMSELMRTPVVKAGAIMPDACPVGGKGVIPVGGVVVSEGIHPGFHSADICCSLFISIYPQSVDKKTLLDNFHAATHFGRGGRIEFEMGGRLLNRVRSNPITKQFEDTAQSHLGTQGDGNHFAYVGYLKSTGNTCLVTHHGSRGFGAKVYKAGMKIAEKYRRDISPETLPCNAWIPTGTKDAEVYWEALQIVREWTKENHRVLHEAAGFRPYGQFWNEHNFVFKKDDGLYYHAKGATPTGFKWAEDATVNTIIPLNMVEPILLVRSHPDAPKEAMGFAPHGAGRNYSRSEHVRRGIGDFEKETKAHDVRFWCGNPDASELPSAYKDAGVIRADIARHKLATIVDQVMPFGSIMAGDVDKGKPWRQPKEPQNSPGNIAKRAARKEIRSAEKAAAHTALMAGQKIEGTTHES